MNKEVSRRATSRFGISGLKPMLKDRTSQLASLLNIRPEEAESFKTQAMLTISKSEKLQNCTSASLFQCVMDAASMGFKLDGRMCHAVPYGKTAQCIPDWKGLVNLAIHTKVIKRATADVVVATDHFRFGREAGGEIFEHWYDHTKSRTGDIVGAYCRIIFPDNSYHVEWMHVDEINAIRGRSRAAKSGPWVTDFNEMAKKTVVKRALKPYQDTKELQNAYTLSDAEYQTVDAVDFETKTETGSAEALRGLLATEGQPAPEEPKSPPKPRGEVVVDSPVQDEPIQEDPVPEEQVVDEPPMPTEPEIIDAELTEPSEAPAAGEWW